MADSIVKLRRSYVPGRAPAVGELAEGQLVVNIADKKFYTKDLDDNIILLADGNAVAETTLTGDVTGVGTGTVATTLANSGVSAGTYTKVTVDAKGRVTVGASLASGDVTTALGFTPYNATNPAGYISANENITISGDASGSGTTAITLTLADSGVTAGTYQTVTVNAKGLVTAGAALTSGDVTTALGFTPEDSANKGVNNGYAGLDAGGKVPVAQLPAIAITDTFVVADETEMLALTAETGDVAIRTDLSKSFILAAMPASTLGNWKELLSPAAAVSSVAGRTGDVVLANTDISGLGTMSTQDASAVAITGGTVAGSTITGNITGNAANVTGTVVVANGGTGAVTLTGYVKGSGTSALTASSTIPNTDITGLGTLSTQDADAVAITGGTIDGVTIDGGVYA